MSDMVFEGVLITEYPYTLVNLSTFHSPPPSLSLTLSLSTDAGFRELTIDIRLEGLDSGTRGQVQQTISCPRILCWSDTARALDEISIFHEKSITFLQ